MNTSPNFFRAALVALVVVAAALMTAAPASAQSSNTEKLFLQVTLDGQGLAYNEDDFSDGDGGGGLSLRAGWGVSRVVTLYAGFGGARMDEEMDSFIGNEYDWGTAEVGARFNLLPSRRFVPYLDVALRGVSATDDDLDFDFTGGGIALGGGASYFISPSVALDAAFRIGGGSFEDVEFGSLATDIDEDDFEYGEGRFSLGLTFYPLR